MVGSLLSCAVLSVAAQGLEIRLADPALSVSVPDLAPFEIGPHPNAPSQPTARLFGSSKDGVSLSVLTPKAEGATAQQCATWLAGNVLSRFAPDLAAVQFVKAGDNAWVLLFPFVVAPVEQLKAYVLSGNGRGQCLEVHISRLGASEQQKQQWLSGFRNVRVKIE
ncbi:MAG: hypothetical protein AB7I35_16230 [Ramlibacter sp.]